MKNGPFVTHTLSNGLRIVIEVMDDVQSAAAGFLARTGGRDETGELAGVSHFLEHMCFKGTAKRSSREINIAFDAMGSTYNAYTSQERTVYYGWVPAEAIDSQIELLADMMQSTLPQEDFDTEKNVVLEEIAMSKDQIEHLAFDLLQEKVYGDHPLAWPVLGYEHTVRDLTRDQMKEYLDLHYGPDHLMLVVAGKVDPDAVIKTADRICGNWQPSGYERRRTSPVLRTGTAVQQVERFNQQVAALVFNCPGTLDEFDATSSVAAAILGGENSRFYWNIMQEGIAMHAGVFRLAYDDCGLMILFGQGEAENCEKMAAAMQEEARKITDGPIDEHEVQRVKNKLRTSLAVESEAPYHRLVQIMEDVDHRSRARTVEERLAVVDAVTHEKVSEYLQQYPITREGYFISVGPRDWPPT